MSGEPQDSASRRDRLSDFMPLGRWFETAIRFLTAALLFSLMALVFADVFARYLFNAPLRGGYELTQLLMGALIFASLPLASAREEHVSIGLLDNVISGGRRRAQRAIVNAMGAGGVGFLAWQFWRHADYIRGWGDYTPDLLIPLAPIFYFMAAMAGLAAMIMLMLAWRYARGATPETPTHAGDI